ncbi:MAG: hypothetical protein INR62_14060 [Rhodospirillales bacterium]|nr:hypothetical protein [Acetobacter sp.]
MRTDDIASAQEATAEATIRPSLTQFINLSKYAYTSGKTPFSHALEKELGYEPLKVDGHLVKRYSEADGFYGQAFISTGAGPKQVIVAFEGTNIHNPPSKEFQQAQIAADVDIFDGVAAQSFADALTFTRRAIRAAAKAGVSRSETFVTGHSLGAAQAEFASSYTGLGGTTFGTPGLSTTITGKHTHAALFNYVDEGDPVGNYASDKPDHLGPIVQSPSIVHVGDTHLVGDAWHAKFLEDAAKLYAEHKFDKDVEAAFILAASADHFHPLANYAQDLHQTLYGPDRTQGSGSKFFEPIDPLSGVLSTPHADQHTIASLHSHGAGFGGGGFFGHLGL